MKDSYSRSLKHTKAFLLFDVFANMAIDAAGGGSSVFGTKPGVAEYTPLDLAAEQKKAVGSNIAAMPDIEALLNKILPGYSDMVKQGSKNTLSLLKGEIPQDVQQRVRSTDAFQSLMGGFAGSDMSKALTARDFGLTSLQLMGQGTNSAQQWANIAHGNVSPMLINPGEQADVTMRNNLYRQATQQFKENVMAAPDPAAAGLFNTISTIGSTAASFGLGMMGGKAPAPVMAGSSAFGGGGSGQGGTQSGFQQGFQSFGSSIPYGG